MKAYASQELRNLALVGHKGAGKTTLAEAMLFAAKATTRLGKVEDGNTVFDFEPEEQRHGGSVQSATAHLTWAGSKMNLLDTPGDPSFIGDVYNCLAVSECVALVVSAPDGLDSQAVDLFKRAEGRARCLIINKLGRERADFGAVLADARARLGPGVVPINLPLGSEDGFHGVVDLLSLKQHVYSANGSGVPRIEELPAALREAARQGRHTLLEEISANDESILEKYLQTNDLSEEETRAALRIGIASGGLCPVLAADAAHGIGIADILDAIATVFPSPAMLRVVQGRDRTGHPAVLPASLQEDFTAVVFKTVVDQHAGKVSICRVLSGAAKKDMVVENLTHHTPERFGSVLTLQGKKLEHVDEVTCGDIMAVPKLKNTDTGDTLAAKTTHVVAFLPPPPPPQIAFRIIPKNKNDEDKISVAVHRLREEDPSLVIGHDAITKEMTLSGYGTSHLDVTLEKLTRKYGVHVDRAPPLVTYRETIARGVRNIEGKHKKQSGGRGQYGVCTIHLTPLERGAGYQFVDSIFGGAIPRQYIPAVDKGIQEALGRGMLAGYPMVDVQVELVDGKYHDVDSSELAFKLAGSKAVQAAAHAAGIVLLEPVMAVTVEAPEEAVGDILGDINGRRGKVMGMDTTMGISRIKALVPMSEMLQYASDLKSKSAGRGAYTMVFDHYDRVPAQLVDKIVAESPKRPAGDDA